MQLLEQGRSDIGRMSARCGSERDRWSGGFRREQDGGDVRVKGEGFAQPVDGFGVVVLSFQGRGDVGVDPEGPEGVVEVEDDYSREGEAVGKGFGGGDAVGDDGGGGGFLYHD